MLASGTDQRYRFYEKRPLIWGDRLCSGPPIAELDREDDYRHVERRAAARRPNSIQYRETRNTGWTCNQRARYFPTMVRQRAAFNPLAPAPAPRWYVVRTMHGSIIESRPLVAGANLTHVFITAMLAWMDGEWTISEFSSKSATFFCSRDLERRMISIETADPYEAPMPGASHLAARGNQYD